MRKIFLLTILAVMATFTNAQTTSSESDEILWGENLTNDISSLTRSSFANIREYSCAVFVPGDKVLKGGKIKAVRVPLPENMNNVRVWVKKNVKDASVIASKSVTDIKADDWNRADFNEAIDIPTEGVYVGFSYESNEIVYYFKECIGSFWLRAGSFDWSQAEFGTIPIGVYISGIEAKENNAAITLPTSSVIKAASSDCSMDIKFTNNSTNELNSLKVSVDNGESKDSYTYNLEAEGRSICAGYGGTVELSIPYTAPSTFTMKNKVTFNVEEVNGKPNSGDMGVAVLNVMTPKGGKERNVLVEENTGTSCGYCVFGYVDMEVMKEWHGDRFAGIAVHQYTESDPMYVSTGNYSRLNFSGAPACKINRTDEIHPRKMHERLEGYMETPPLVDITATAEWNEAGTAINISSDIESMINDLDIEVAYVLTADGLTKMSPAWAQNNYLASEEPELLYPEDPIADFYTGGKYASNPVLGLVYNDIAISTSYKNSQTEVAPITGLKLGDHSKVDYTLKYQTTDELKELIDREKTHLVVIVNTKDGPTANALKIPVKVNSTGISGTQADKVKVTKTYTIDGRETNGTVKGINIVKMSDGTVKKVMVK